MSADSVATKRELLTEMETGYSTLLVALRRLSEAQWTESSDAQGWTVVDHITHLAAWERSVTSLLLGGSRFDGLGIDEWTYRNGDFDSINALIQRREAGNPPQGALKQLGDAHEELLKSLAPLSEEQLALPTDRFSLTEAREGDAPRTLDVIFANTAAHYREHLEWIEKIAD